MPPSGLKEITNGDDAERARPEAPKETEALGEQDLRFKATAAHAVQLANLMLWGEMAESSEALTLLIYHSYKLGLENFPFFASSARVEIESDQHIKTERTEIRLMARRGTVQQIDEMDAWINATDRSFIVRRLIERAHALGPIQVLTLLALPPRHKFVVSDSVARSIDQFRRSLKARDPDFRFT